jgi:hypothetical protein
VFFIAVVLNELGEKPMIWLTLYVNDYDKQSCSFASYVTNMCKIPDYGRIKMFLKIYLEVEKLMTFYFSLK